MSVTSLFLFEEVEPDTGATDAGTDPNADAGDDEDNGVVDVSEEDGATGGRSKECPEQKSAALSAKEAGVIGSH